MTESIHSGHRERIREQYQKTGAQSFLDHQFLELLLTYAIPRRDTNELAHALLERFGSLEGVVTAEIGQLLLVDGIGESAAVFLRMQGDLYRRLQLKKQEDARGNVRLSSPVAAARYAVSLLSLSTYETVIAVCLNAKKVVQSYETVQSGTLSEAQIYPRTVAEIALLRRAHGILLLHNHPSGDPTPSAEDVEATESVRAALQSVGVQLFDHLVVGGQHAYSFSTRAVIGTSGAEPEVYSLADYQAHRADQPRTVKRVMEQY
ncbi:MAG: DNA repair protein RadC [Eubacteriales bacterium]|nr:DNA repair protein RadC [Eubacteriales bacterium]